MNGFKALVQVLILIMLVACSDQHQQSPTLRIGLIAPINGALSAVGRSSVEAAQLAVREINDAGGLILDGQAVRVELRVADNQDRAEAAASAALRLINADFVSAIVGPQASRNAIAAANVAERANIPMISPWSTHIETTRDKRWVFRVAFVDSFQGQLMARFSRDQLRIGKVAILFDIASEYNRGLAAEFRTGFEALGGRVVAFESYTRDAPDVSAQLQRIAGSGAEALFLPNYHNEVPAQVRRAKALGLQLQLLGSDSWALIPAVHRRVLQGAYFSAHYAAEETIKPAMDPATGPSMDSASDSADDLVRRFISHYQQAYDRVPDDVAALTYDAFGLLWQAAKNRRSIDPQALRDGLAELSVYQGVTGRMRYAGSADPLKSAVVMQVREGRFHFHSRVHP